jgi:hypothetical protein
MLNLSDNAISHEAAAIFLSISAAQAHTEHVARAVSAPLGVDSIVADTVHLGCSLRH